MDGNLCYSAPDALFALIEELYESATEINLERVDAAFVYLAEELGVDMPNERLKIRKEVQ